MVIKKERRIIDGQSYDVKTVENNILEVFDPEKKVYIPYGIFLRSPKPKVDEDKPKEATDVIDKIIDKENVKIVKETRKDATEAVDKKYGIIDAKKIEKVDDKKKESKIFKKEEGNIVDQYIDLLF